MDSEQTFKKHCAIPEYRQQLQDLNWLDPRVITYKYNNHGFRTADFDQQPSGLALGCSYTEGVGVAQDQTWPSVLSKLCNYHIWNLGVGGCSFDTVFRLLEYYLPKLNVQFVCVLPPPPTRFEFCDINGDFISVAPYRLDRYPDFGKAWLTQQHNQDITARKNLLAIQQICALASIPLFVNQPKSHIYYDRQARDLAHPGTVAQQWLAEQFLDQMQLSKSAFMKFKFRNQSQS
jgi:hypothetical protein